MTGFRPFRDLFAWFAYRRIRRQARANLARGF